jgi:hypothetical protein
MTMLQKRVASDSSRYTATQAGGPGNSTSRIHDETSVVLPLPQGGEHGDPRRSPSIEHGEQARALHEAGHH